jgi:hypothetical protein
LPSLVAVIALVPAAIAVTRPELLTDAAPVFPDVQTIDRPVRTLLLASLRTAVACVVAPTRIEPDASVTETLATGTRATETAADPLFPSLVAVMLQLPVPTAVTTPALFTVATAAALVDQTTERPVRTLLFASFRTAVA